MRKVVRANIARSGHIPVTRYIIGKEHALRSRKVFPRRGFLELIRQMYSSGGGPMGLDLIGLEPLFLAVRATWLPCFGGSW